MPPPISWPRQQEPVLVRDDPDPLSLPGDIARILNEDDVYRFDLEARGAFLNDFERSLRESLDPAGDRSVCEMRKARDPLYFATVIYFAIQAGASRLFEHLTQALAWRGHLHDREIGAIKEACTQWCAERTALEYVTARVADLLSNRPYTVMYYERSEALSEVAGRTHEELCAFEFPPDESLDRFHLALALHGHESTDLPRHARRRLEDFSRDRKSFSMSETAELLTRTKRWIRELIKRGELTRGPKNRVLWDEKLEHLARLNEEMLASARGQSRPRTSP